MVDIAFERISELGWWMIGAYLKDLEFSKLNLAIRLMHLNFCSAQLDYSSLDCSALDCSPLDCSALDCSVLD